MMGPIDEGCMYQMCLFEIDWEHIQEARIVVVLSSLNRSLPLTEYFMCYFNIKDNDKYADMKNCFMCQSVNVYFRKWHSSNVK